MNISEATWTTARVEDRGRPIIFRIRTGLESQRELHRRFPNRLAVLWRYPLQGPEGAEGLPTPEQLGSLTSFEDVMISALESQGIALLTSVATSAGLREWVWYCATTNEFNKAFNAALRGHPRYPLDLQVSSDVNWEGYRGLVNALGLAGGKPGNAGAQHFQRPTRKSLSRCAAILFP